MPQLNTFSELGAIDVHAHYGLYETSEHPVIRQCMSRTAEGVVACAHQARTAISIVSPLRAFFSTEPDALLSANEQTDQAVSAHPELLQWVVVNPLETRSFEQADRILQDPRCIGIKIHPELHHYPIAEHGDAIFRFAARHRTVIISHTGESRSLPEDFVPFADAHPEATLILAHLGFGFDGDPTHQVRAVQAARHANVFIDTSSARNIVPGLLEWAAHEVGAERLLFGTDSPLYFAPMQRARINCAELDHAAKRLILRENALRVLHLEPFLQLVEHSTQ